MFTRIIFKLRNVSKPTVYEDNEKNSPIAIQHLDKSA